MTIIKDIDQWMQECVLLLMLKEIHMIDKWEDLLWKIDHLMKEQDKMENLIEVKHIYLNILILKN